MAEPPGPADSPPAADELVGPAVEVEQAPEAPVEPPAEEEPAAPLPAVAAAAAGALAGSMPAAVPPAVAEPVEVEAEPVEAEPMDGEPAVPAVALPVIAVGPVTARHRIDPLPNPQRGRFRRRRGRNDSPIVVVPARPPTTRVLPRGRREDPM